MASLKDDLPQEGTSSLAGGESLPAASAAGCPSYSGGGKNCLTDTTTTLATKMDSEARDLAQETMRRPSLEDVLMKEARVLLERVPIAVLNASQQRLAATSDTPDSVARMECDDGAASDSDCRPSVALEGFGAKRPRLSDCSTDDDRAASPAAAKWRQQQKRAAAKARAASKEEDLEKETGLARFRRETRAALFPRPAAGGERCAAQLQEQVREDLEVIAKVATKSSSLKGTFVRALKDAAASIKDAVEVLGARTQTEETKQLQEDNVRLRAEMAALRMELAEIKESLRKRGSASHPDPDVTMEAAPTSRPLQTTPSETPSVEEICRAVMVQVGGMMNARLASLEDRLLPEKNMRPPLAADKKRGEGTYAAKLARQPPQLAAQPGPSGTHRWAPPAPQQRSGGSAQSLPKFQEASSPPSGGKERKKRRKKKKKKRNSPPGQQQSQPAVGEWIKVGPKRRPQVKSGVDKLHAPRSSAVTITLQPGAAERGVTYANIIASAKERINPADFGAQGVRLRKAANGGRVFEFPGASSGEKADSLAQRLREVLDDGVVRVSRPVKTVALRVAGLDDATTAAEVVAAIAAAGGCQTEQLRAGAMSTGRDGLGSIVVQCPVVAAKKIATNGRLLVGWVSAQARLLDPRPTVCYRCLAPGHLSGQCQAGVDRSGICFRCGQPGHKARGCTAAPRCVVCAAAGAPAEHRAGSKACVPPPKGRRNRKPGGDGPSQTAGQSSNLTHQAAAPVVEEVPMAIG
ncbi:PREDICTED: uncharacterized protein LOC106123200 [Papilio xuthus]|uniref:Uncharacterized protein LOC106123200 n=1 Tax=Papilio xuthus TaxID=66420 RepID=A0AAJ7EF40_PAPXU|nr:PREDICTED: uncharacterized protein LOC106123200 [Papilio xuthus]